MLTIIICSIIGVIVFVYNEYRMSHNNLRLSYFIDYLASVFIGCGVGYLIGIAIAFPLPMKTETTTQTYNLESVNLETEYNRFKYDSISIKFTDEKPKIEIVYVNYDKKALINKFALDLGYPNTKHYLIITLPKQIK